MHNILETDLIYIFYEDLIIFAQFTNFFCNVRKFVFNFEYLLKGFEGYFPLKFF